MICLSRTTTASAQCKAAAPCLYLGLSARLCIKYASDGLCTILLCGHVCVLIPVPVPVSERLAPEVPIRTVMPRPHHPRPGEPPRVQGLQLVCGGSPRAPQVPTGAGAKSRGQSHRPGVSGTSYRSRQCFPPRHEPSISQQQLPHLCVPVHFLR